MNVAHATASLSRRARAVAASLLAFPLVAAPALANPTGGVVSAGSASIRESGGLLVVEQASNRAILDWSDFSIGAGERTHFAQPSARAIALNRVRGGNVSEIFGRLTADGRIVLVNPAGFHFGPSAHVDVAGLIASSADLLDESFLSRDRWSFDLAGASGARVVNEGVLDIRGAGLAALVAPSVENRGVIRARLGRIALASSDRFTVDLYGDGLLELALAPDAGEAGRGVWNSGALAADGGWVALMSAEGARAALDGVVNTTGVIRARSISSSDGRIVLTGGDDARIAVDGALDARGDGARGGEIDVFGGEIALGSAARLEASGTLGGGTIRVGGDLQGSGAMQRARTLDVATGASLAADAVRSGNGGRIVLWSDGDTHFAGRLSALGAAGAVGGFAEVSGKRTLSFLGDATLGAGGRLLLDPTEILISDGAGATVTIDTLRRQLYSGTSVELLATNDIVLGATLDARATKGATPGAGLTLRSSAGSILLDADLITNQGAVTLDAEVDVIQSATRGALVAGGGVAIVVSDGLNGLFDADVTIQAGGSIDLQYLATRGDVSLDAGGALSFRQGLGTLANPIASLMATAASIDAAPSVVTGGGGVTLTASGALVMAPADQIFVSNGSGAVQTGAGSVQLSFGAGDLELGDVETSGQVAIAFTGSGAGGRVTLHEQLGGSSSPIGGLDIDAPVVDQGEAIVARGNVSLGRALSADCQTFTACTILRRDIFTGGGDFTVRGDALIDPRRPLLNADGTPIFVDRLVAVADGGPLTFAAMQATEIGDLAVYDWQATTLAYLEPDPQNVGEFITYPITFAERFAQSQSLIQNGAFASLFPNAYQQIEANNTRDGLIGEVVHTTWTLTLDTVGALGAGDVVFTRDVHIPADTSSLQATGVISGNSDVMIQGLLSQGGTPSYFFGFQLWHEWPVLPRDGITSAGHAATADGSFESIELNVAAGSGAVRFDGVLQSRFRALLGGSYMALQLNVESAGSLAFGAPGFGDYLATGISRLNALRVPAARLGAPASGPLPAWWDAASDPGHVLIQPRPLGGGMSDIIEVRLQPGGNLNAEWAFDFLPLGSGEQIAVNVVGRAFINPVPTTGSFTSTPVAGGGNLGAPGGFAFDGGGGGLFGGVGDLGNAPGVPTLPFADRSQDATPLADEEDPVADGGDSSRCASALPTAYQRTPGQAAFGGDPRGGPFSVDVFCGSFSLVQTNDPDGSHFGALSFPSRDFWTDAFERAADGKGDAGAQ